MSDSDGLNPENPEAEGLTPPELSVVEIVGDRLVANEAGGRLGADGFTDVEIDRWVKIYYTQAEGGVDQGDVEGLIAFIREQQESGSAD
ncbi:MAG: hypothetical protein ACXWA3_01555 [Acidimicrobiales bacterium]